jgi:hypothetical protein
MKQVNYLSEDRYPEGVCAIVKNRKISFALFQKAIKLNTELRQQIRDIVDLGLCEYAFRVNSEIITAAKEKAEAQSTEIMMKFLKGAGNYQFMKHLIHRNRVIRLLAQKELREQDEFLNRLKQLKVV